MTQRSLRSHISLTIAFVVVLLVVLISILSNILINQKFKDYMIQQQKAKTSEIALVLSQYYDFNEKIWSDDVIHSVGMNYLDNGYIIKISNNKGKIIWDAQSHDMSRCQQIVKDISKRMKRVNGKFTSQTFELKKSNQKVGSMVISFYGPYFLNKNEFKFLSALNTVLVSVGIFSLVTAVIIGWLLARKINKPLKKTLEITQEIAQGNYEKRMDLLINISELNELMTSVNQLAETLNAHENLRKQLSADVAHELRTPLTSVATHLEAMIEGVWQPTPQRLQSCYEEIERLSEIVADLEQLAQVESDNLNLEFSDVDLNALIEAMVSNLELRISNKQLQVLVHGSTTIANVDKARLSQTFYNLLTNAIKYTAKGGKIDIWVYERNEFITVEIKDSGIGIEQADIPHLFERFYRVDSSRNRQTGGAGIGLAIVKSIVKAHGGDIKVTSSRQQGSIFSISLPSQTR